MIEPIPGNAILECVDLSWPWQGIDPFLLCGHHQEHYPPGNAQQALPPELRHDQPDQPGADEGYRLYAGLDGMPGFPSHPHRGMETVTVLRQGYIDHADSLGASGRYGPGDVQWMTAGAGIQHAESFPLLHADAPNPLELFQIWLNMPARAKMAPPAYKMLWAEAIPRHVHGAVPAQASLAVVAGRYAPTEPGTPALAPITPPPDSWAAQAEADFAIWMIRLEPGASLLLPAAQQAATQRTLFVYLGSGLQVDAQPVGANRRVRVIAQQSLQLANPGAMPVELMLMQGVPLNEPVIRSTVYVTNTLAELHQAKRDFQRTQFGGWPWATRQPTHGPGFARFSQRADGMREEP